MMQLTLVSNIESIIWLFHLQEQRRMLIICVNFSLKTIHNMDLKFKSSVKLRAIRLSRILMSLFRHPMESWWLEVTLAWKCLFKKSLFYKSLWLLKQLMQESLSLLPHKCYNPWRASQDQHEHKYQM